jgi:hypothetical protein
MRYGKKILIAFTHFLKSLGISAIKAYISLTMSTLIIHPKDPSTNFLKPIYAPIQDKTVITGGISIQKLRTLIEVHEKIIMLGHGTPWGLLSVGQFPKVGNYVIDWSMVDLLSTKTDSIYIWCHADQFVKNNQLMGFFSGMFISEFGEAFSLGYYVSNRNLITESNDSFASCVSQNIHQPLIVMYGTVIQEYALMAKVNPIAQFNLERLYLLV